MILTASSILELEKTNELTIANTQIESSGLLNPNSIDITLSKDVLLYNGGTIDTKKGADNTNCFDSITIGEEGYIFQKGSFILASTNEYISTQSTIGIIYGKSSIGRCGIDVSCGAGFGDVGYEGNWTLCISFDTNVKLYPNMKIGQIAIYAPLGNISINYSQTGRYQGSKGIQTSKGV